MGPVNAQEHPIFQRIALLHERLHGCFEAVRFRFRQKAHMPQIDAQQRCVRPHGLLRRTKQRTVSAQGDQRIQLLCLCQLLHVQIACRIRLGPDLRTCILQGFHRSRRIRRRILTSAMDEQADLFHALHLSHC